MLGEACASGSLPIVKTLVEKGEAPTAADVDASLFYGNMAVATYLNDVLKKTQGQEVDLRKRCEMKPTSGHCKAAFFRGYYDTLAKKCTGFIHGGCGGTVPFYSVEACRNVCEDGSADGNPVTGKDQ
jgi:hypothetical protein